MARISGFQPDYASSILVIRSKYFPEKYEWQARDLDISSVAEV